MPHRRAKLTPLGRLLIVHRVEELGWTVAATADAAGVSRATAHKWVRRYREEGEVGLQDRTSAPRRCPHALPPRTVHRVLKARRRLKRGPHHLGAVLGMPRSTVYGVLRRSGMSRLDHTDRPSGVPIRYERDHPGELLHVDVKKLARIPDGGGWRMLGRSSRTKHRGGGYDYLHACVDDHSRVAYVEVHADERGETCAAFLARAAGFFAERGVRIHQVMTDNALNCVRSEAFLAALAVIGATHQPIPPYRPRANGKVERFNRTLVEEWPTSGCTHPTDSALQPCPDGYASTTSVGPTPHSEGSPRRVGCEQRRWELHLVMGPARGAGVPCGLSGIQALG